MYFTTQALHITGQAFGTSYAVKVVLPQIHDADLVKEKIDVVLKDIDGTFSTYKNTSLLSSFNNGKTISLNDDFTFILKKSKWLYQKSNGAWDPSIQPLFLLWQFDDALQRHIIPSKSDIKHTLTLLGFDKLKVDEQTLFSGLLFSDLGVQLDFSSIAKGYAVDKVANLLEALNAESYLIEIGGELRSFGDAPGKKAWRVGINSPDPEALATSVFKVVELTDKALATSGTYRHFFDKNGKRYSHILDPRTGYPVRHNVVSVSVIADDCTIADGLATALLVMGVEDGLTLVNALENVEAMFILDNNNGFDITYSRSFEMYLSNSK